MDHPSGPRERQDLAADANLQRFGFFSTHDSAYLSSTTRCGHTSYP
jgi:hypothetical protein